MGDPCTELRKVVRLYKESLREIATRAKITAEEYTKKFENFIHPGLTLEELKPFVDHLDSLNELDMEFHELWQKKERVSPVFWENAFASRAFGALEEVRVYDDIMKRFAKKFRGGNSGPNHKKPRKRNARKGDVHNDDRAEPSQEASVSS